METPLAFVMFVDVRLYLMHPRRAPAKELAFGRAEVLGEVDEVYLVRSGMMLANSLVSARASETV